MTILLGLHVGAVALANCWGNDVGPLQDDSPGCKNLVGSSISSQLDTIRPAYNHGCQGLGSWGCTDCHTRSINLTEYIYSFNAPNCPLSAYIPPPLGPYSAGTGTEGYQVTC